MDEYIERLKALLSKTNHAPGIEFTKVNCPIHGRRWLNAYFLTPKPWSGIRAQYVCALCIDAIENKMK